MSWCIFEMSLVWSHMIYEKRELKKEVAKSGTLKNGIIIQLEIITHTHHHYRYCIQFVWREKTHESHEMKRQMEYQNIWLSVQVNTQLHKTNYIQITLFSPWSMLFLSLNHNWHHMYSNAYIIQYQQQHTQTKKLQFTKIYNTYTDIYYDICIFDTFVFADIELRWKKKKGKTKTVYTRELQQWRHQQQQQQRRYRIKRVHHTMHKANTKISTHQQQKKRKKKNHTVQSARK